jgi:hypothetical protein
MRNCVFKELSQRSREFNKKAIEKKRMMMRTLATLFLGIAIFLGNGCTTDFDRGFEAYQSGDYEQAASFE